MVKFPRSGPGLWEGWVADFAHVDGYCANHIIRVCGALLKHVCGPVGCAE